MPDDYNYGISVTVSNLASAELSKINKQLDGLGKQVQKNAKTTERGAKDEQKALRGYGTQIKEQLTTRKYLNNLLRQDQQTFKKTNKLISEQGALSKINTDIRKKGYSAISKAEKESLKNSAKAIRLRQKGGMQLAGWARTNEEAILKVDENFRKHGTNLRKTVTGINASFSGLGKAVHKVGMTFLTIIGPLFLVGAAIRIMQQAIDSIMQPFLGFEDGLYELRKTADLTKQEMLAMGDAIELMAQRIPIARKELVEIAATAGRLGIQGRENILNFTEVVAMMATATVLSADEAANALARVSNAFQLPIANVEYLGSIINELSNTTASNSREIVKSIENVGASGKMIGIAIDAVAAMSATLISAGMSSERSGTRLRRFFTEMARNSSKMAEAMDIDAATMKISIEEDPTKAIMEYLKHLREVPSRIDKVVEAQEIFGKVGGFAVATLAENYVELEKNMSNARTELAFGTSLQREFEIAISKTSAQLQMLDNRIEAATAGIGEDFVPVIKGGKGVLADMAEALGEVSDGFWAITDGADDATTALEAMTEEMERLLKESKEEVSALEKIGLSYRLFLELQRGMTLGPGIWEEMISNIKSVGKEMITTKDGAEELAEVFEIQDKLIQSANVAYGLQVKNIKEVTDFQGKYGSVLKDIEDLNIKIRDSERGMAAAEKEGIEVSKERNQLMIDEEILRIRGMQTTRNAIKEKIEMGAATEEEKRRYAELNSYLEGYGTNLEGASKAISKANATKRLQLKTLEWTNKELTKESDFYIHLEALVGDHADAILNSGNAQAALNKIGYEAVMIGDRLVIVLIEEAKRLYELEDPLHRITAAFDKFGKETSETMEELIERMAKAREESSLLYYDIANQASIWNELGNIMVTDNKTMRESISNFTDLEKSGRRLVVTHKGLEAITTAEAAKMKKLGKQIIYVTDAMEEMNELGQDSITIWGQLTITQSDYEDRLNSIWGMTSSYIGVLRKLSDKQIEFTDASRTMPIRIQEMWRPYEGAFKRAKELAEQGKVGEANTVLQGIAAEVYDKKIHASSKKQQKDWDNILRYIDDFVVTTGIIPNELQEVEDELQLMQDLLDAIASKEVIITPDLNDTPFSEAMKRLLDADYITSIRVEADLVGVKKQIEEVAAVTAFKTPSVEKMEEVAKKPYVVPKEAAMVPIPFDPTRGVPEHIGKHYEHIGDAPLRTEESGIVTKVTEGFSNAATVIGNAIADPIGTMNTVAEKFDATVEKWDSALTGGKVGEGLETIKGGAEKVWDWLGGKASGGPIPKTGLYTLHEGEHVLNKGETSHVKNVHAALGLSSIVPSMKKGGTAGSAKNPLVSPKEVLSKMWHEIGESEAGNINHGIIDAMAEGGGIDETGIYQLHKGEVVLPKGDVDAIETGLGSSSNPIKNAITNLEANEIKRIATVVNAMPNIMKTSMESGISNTKNYDMDTVNTRTQNYNDNIKRITNNENIYGATSSAIGGERTIHINIKNVVLDENYDVKKFINDMEEIAMSG